MQELTQQSRNNEYIINGWLQEKDIDSISETRDAIVAGIPQRNPYLIKRTKHAYANFRGQLMLLLYAYFINR